jgi:hypothetical protein
MSKSIVFAGLLFLTSLVAARPAGALCYECRYAGFVCTGVGWCSETYVCSGTSSFCSVCWEVCYENMDSYCSWNRPCEWAEKLPADNLSGDDSFLSSLMSGAGSCAARS